MSGGFPFNFLPGVMKIAASRINKLGNTEFIKTLTNLSKSRLVVIRVVKCSIMVSGGYLTPKNLWSINRWNQGKVMIEIELITTSKIIITTRLILVYWKKACVNNAIEVHMEKIINP